MKSCPSFPGYSAAEDGRIFSHRRRGCGKQRGSVSIIDFGFSYELTQRPLRKGYRTVSIVLTNGKSRPVGVHRLVADAFHGPCPKGQQVRHMNGIPSDNSPDNLRYGTPLENADDRRRHGTYLGGSNHHGAKLSGGQAAAIRRRRRMGEKVADLARSFGVSVSTIEGVIYGKTYKPVTIEFKRI